MTLEQILERYGPVVCNVTSSSEPGKQWEVRSKDGVNFTCNCPRWRFKRDCKHIGAVSNLGTAKPILEPDRKDTLVEGILGVIQNTLTDAPRSKDLAAKIAAWVRANNVLTEPVVPTPAEPVKKKVRLIILQD